jgi:hypothetical protein
MTFFLLLCFLFLKKKDGTKKRRKRENDTRKKKKRENTFFEEKKRIVTKFSIILIFFFLLVFFFVLMFFGVPRKNRKRKVKKENKKRDFFVFVDFLFFGGFFFSIFFLFLRLDEVLSGRIKIDAIITTTKSFSFQDFREDEQITLVTKRSVAAKLGSLLEVEVRVAHLQVHFLHGLIIVTNLLDLINNRRHGEAEGLELGNPVGAVGVGVDTAGVLGGQVTAAGHSVLVVDVDGVHTKNGTSEDRATQLEVDGPDPGEAPPDVHLLVATLPETVSESGEDGGGETSEVGGLTVVEAALPAFRRGIADLEGRNVGVQEFVTVKVSAAADEPGDVEADEGSPEDGGVGPLGARVGAVDLTGGVAALVPVDPGVDHDTIDVEAALSGRVGLNVGDDFGNVDEVVDGVPTPHTYTVTMTEEPVLFAEEGIRSREIDNWLVSSEGMSRITELIVPGVVCEPVGTVSTR